MNTPDESPGDELTREYRLSSDADAASPAAATRAAILAEARAAALRRTPAANESRYLWRAAAGIAVLGVAVVLWRQVNQDLTPDLTVAAPAHSTAATEPPMASQPAGPRPVADAAGAADEPAPASPVASVAARVEKEVQLQATSPTRTREEAAESAAAPSDAPQAEAPQADLRLARASADAGPALAAAAAHAAGTMRKDSPDYQQLMQREFPAVWNGSEPPHVVWVVMDASGKVLRKGELPPGASVTADQPFESQRPWEMIKVAAANGSSLQLAVMHVD